MLLFPALLAPSGYIAAETRWRQAEEAALRQDDGWPAVAGLFWLGDGITAVGSAKGCGVRLPDGPPLAGTATVAAGQVWFQPEGGALAALRSDATRLRIGRLTLMAIQRGKRIGLRVFDPLSARRRTFHGLRWFPVDPAYRIVARFVPYATPKTLMITNVLGDVRAAPCPGYAEFRLGGRTVRLDAEAAGNGLFFNFRDLTSGRGTYGAGRFLDAPKPANGHVVLDFNRATNPPCAFTDFATCPLPPKGNVLPIAVRAGALNGHAEEAARPVTREP